MGLEKYISVGCNDYGLALRFPRFTSSPNVAPSGFSHFFPKTDGKWYSDANVFAYESFVSTAVSDHVGLADPHTQYQKESEKNTASGYAGLDAGTKVAVGQIPNLPASIITSLQLALARGGTNADLSVTGGVSQVLKQVSAGAAITVGQLAIADLSNGADVIKRDGSVAFTGNQSFGGNKITSLGTPTAGTDAATKDYVDGAGGGWITVEATANQTKNNDAVVAVDDHLIFSMLADRYYEFEAEIFFDTGSAVGFDWRHVGTAAATKVTIQRHTVGCGNTVFGNIANDTAYSGADISVPGSGSTGGYIKMTGVILNGKSASDFEFHWAQGTATKSDTVRLAGSRIRYRLMP